MTKKDDQVSIQVKLTRLDELVAWFDGDEFQLEEASAKLKQAKSLATEIEHGLDTVVNEITIVKQSFATDES